MTEQPIDNNIFEYIFSHYDVKIHIEEEAKRYKERILTKQYGFEDGPVAERMEELDDPRKNTEFVKKLALDMGADLVGIAKVKKEYFFKGRDLEHRFAISLALEMDWDRIEQSPGPPSATEVLKIYCKLGEITINLAARIRKLGYEAYGHHPRGSNKNPSRLLHIAYAVDAGLGELGRVGLLITPEYGPRVRLGTVTTNLPLVPDKSKEFGFAEFCESCNICVKECEGDAIPMEKTEVRGLEKYKVDPYKCGPYFGETDGCSVCVKVCAFNKKSK